MAKRTINQHLRDIEQTYHFGFARGQNKRQADDKQKKAKTFAKNTTKNDLRITQDFARFVHERHGVTDPRFYKTEYGHEWVTNLLERFQRGELAAGSVKTYVHAVSKYQNMVRDQQNFRARIINVEAELARAKEAGAIRRYANSEKGRIISHQEATHMVTAFKNGRSINSETMSHIAEFQLYTGSRITAALRIQVQHLNFDKNTVTFVADKGGKTRTVQVDPSYMQELKTLVEGKIPGRQVFEILKPNGTLKNIESSRKNIESAYARHAAKLGLEGANTHSQRKAFANDRYREYRALPSHEARAELARRASESKQLANKINKIGRIYGEKRMSDEKVAKMLTSIDLGHERMDVLAWYLSSGK